MVEEFKKIHKPKISKLKDGYCANAILIFSSWLKDLDRCVCNHNLTEHKAVQLIKDLTTNHTWGVVKFYLGTNKERSYSKLVKH